jgi:lipopolysaccharide export system permease protein
MFHIKRLYLFLIKSFLPLLAVMFSVCLFVLLMQFLWKYIDIMVGKGVEASVLAELFFYAANGLVPMCLPLAVLLASLMTFGNLGERFELLAIKAAGISLFRIMKPLIYLLVFISIAIYFYQDIVLPRTQIKFGTILMSLRQKSPELNIPERTFYTEMPGYNIYVGKKENNGMLRNMMIYNYQQRGNDNDAAVIVADSGYLKISADKTFNVLALFSGESFQNLRRRRTNRNDELVPYMREKFNYKEILIRFDSNFNMVDESIMLNRDVSKNMSSLRQFIDSMKIQNDSVHRVMAPLFINQTYATAFRPEGQKAKLPDRVANGDSLRSVDLQSIFDNSPVEKQLSTLENAKSNLTRRLNDGSLRLQQQNESKKMLRSHQIELNRRYATAAVCLLFFFIGAPLGAIIRKGGLGLPAVISVFIFILYYSIDTFGFKMAKQGVWPVWQGMWLGPLLLAGLGVFITHKAINDFMLNMEDLKKVMRTLKRIGSWIGFKSEEEE